MEERSTVVFAEECPALMPSWPIGGYGRGAWRGPEGVERLVKSDGEIVLVLAPHTLRYPQDDRRQHHGHVLRDVGVAVVLVLLRVCLQIVLQDEHALKQQPV